jgi:O-antigen/teichoic acid export membrane protein
VIKKAIAFLKGTAIENDLAKGSALAFLIQGVGATLLLLTEIVAARLLGVSQFGIYSMATAWIYVLGLLAALGLNQTLLRFVPMYLAHEQWGHLRGIVRRANMWGGLAALAVSLSGILILMVGRTYGVIGSHLFLAFCIALATLPIVVLSSIRQAVLRGINKIAHALTPEFILRPSIFLFLLVGGAYLVRQPIDATTAFILSLTAGVASFAIGALWQNKYFPAPARFYKPIYQDREWILVSLPLLTIVGLNLISSRIDVIMLGMLSEVENVGIYSASSRIADVIVFGLASANAVVAPMIARLHSTGNHDELQKMVALTAKGIFLFTFPVAIVVLIFGKQILGIFGPDFSEGYTVLVILVCGQLVNALSGPVGYLMSMTGHQAKAMKIVAFSAFLNLLLNMILIPKFGMTGAAIASAVSTATWNILMLRFVQMELAVNASVITIFRK